MKHHFCSLFTAPICGNCYIVITFKFVKMIVMFSGVDNQYRKMNCVHLTKVIIMFAPCINSIKALFIVPSDAHNYKIIVMLKTIKIPTCFGSRRNHHQGAISCLAKTTIMILLCSSLMTWSMLWRHISLLCKCAVHGRGRNFLPN